MSEPPLFMERCLLFICGEDLRVQLYMGKSLKIHGGEYKFGLCS